MPSAHLLRTLGVVVSVGLLASLPAIGCREASGIDDSQRNVLERDGAPKGTYKVVPTPSGASDAEKDAMTKGSGPSHRVVYLNRNGGSFKPGYDDAGANKSSVLSTAAKIPAYEKSDGSWKKLAACVRAQLAPYDVDVVEKDPGAAPHVEVVVGGTPKNVGMAEGSAGVAPMNADCSVVEKAVVYVFSQSLGEDRECAIATQEIGNAFGLDHVMLCDDAMSYGEGCAAKSFQDVEAKCGEYKSRSCLCGGDTQNSAKKLMKTLGLKPTAPLTPDGSAPPPPGKGDGGAPPIPGKDGGAPTPPDDGGAPAPPGGDAAPPPPVDDGGAPPPPIADGGAPPVPGKDGGAPVPPDDGGAPEPPKRGDDTTPPSVGALSPADGATLPANTTIDIRATIDDPSGISKAVLRWTIGTKTVDWACGDFLGEVTCEKSAGVYTWHVPVGTGSRQWAIRAVDGKGNETTTTTRTIDLSGSAPPPTPPPSSCAITFDSPTAGSSLSPGDHFTVSVTVSCSVSAVKLIWRSPVGDMPYDLSGSGGSWSTELDLSPSASAGTRDLLVTATADDGKTYDATETIHISP
ncbi:MAG: hypothetical protein ACXVEE_02485 [Polyangiales bacterium]